MVSHKCPILANSFSRSRCFNTILRSYYGDTAKTTSIKKLNLYFTYKSRDILKSYTLFITVEAITKLNLGHRDKFKIEFKKKLPVVVHVVQTTQNLVISRCCFAEDSEDMYNDL